MADLCGEKDASLMSTAQNRVATMNLSARSSSIRRTHAKSLQAAECPPALTEHGMPSGSAWAGNRGRGPTRSANYRLETPADLRPSHIFDSTSRAGPPFRGMYALRRPESMMTTHSTQWSAVVLTWKIRALEHEATVSRQSISAVSSGRLLFACLLLRMPLAGSVLRHTA